MGIKIAIIENQQSHFDDLCDLLKATEEFPSEIYPAEKNKYVELADLARISLDCRYKLEKQEAAQLQLEKLLEHAKPDILIVDCILLGFVSAKKENPNGINLVLKLWKGSSLLKNIPVLFLSSAPPNDSAIQNQLNKISADPSIKYKPIWESKKQFGDTGSFGNQDYCDKYIKSKIITLVNKTKAASHWEEFLTMSNVIINEALDRGDADESLLQATKRYHDIICNCKDDLTKQEKFMNESTPILEEIKTMCVDTGTAIRDKNIAKKLNSISGS